MATRERAKDGHPSDGGAAFVVPGAEIVDARVQVRPRPPPDPTGGSVAWTPFTLGLVVNLALVVAFNAVPLWGVATRGWSVFAIVFLYWAENLIVGAVNLAKLGLIGRHQHVDTSAPFFAFHYGGFCLVHGFLVVVFFHQPNTPWEDVGLGLLALLASHAVTFVYGFWLPGLARRAHPGLQLFAPYPRIIVVHLTVIIGANLIGAGAAPVAGLQVLVVLKTAVELLALLVRVESGADADGTRG